MGLTINIALCQNDNIGDFIVTLPFIDAVRRHFSDARIVLFGNNQNKPIAQISPLIDTFLPIQDATLENIRPQNFEICFFMGANCPLEFENIFQIAGVPIRIGMKKIHKSHNLTHRIAYPLSKSRGHIALTQFDMLAQFGIPKPTLQMLMQNQHRFFNTQHLQPYFASDLRYVVLHCKSNRHGKEWPIASYNQLKQRLNEQGLTVIFTGSVNERPEVLSECPTLLEGELVVDLFGKTAMTEFFSVLKFSQATVCSGTGPLHLAAALDVKTIGLFPPYFGANLERWAPLGRHTIVLEGAAGCKKAWYRKHLTQKQCHKLNDSCACMRNIESELVFNTITAMLQH